MEALEPLVIKNVVFRDTGSYEGTPIQAQISELDGREFTVLMREFPRRSTDGLDSSIIKIVHPDNYVWFDRKTWKKEGFFSDKFRNTVFCFIEAAC